MFSLVVHCNVTDGSAIMDRTPRTSGNLARKTVLSGRLDGGHLTHRSHYNEAAMRDIRIGSTRVLTETATADATGGCSRILDSVS